MIRDWETEVRERRAMRRFERGDESVCKRIAPWLLAGLMLFGLLVLIMSRTNLVVP